MNRARIRKIAAVSMVTILFAATTVKAQSDTGSGTAIDRWYTGQQVILGRELFLTHCAACHGKQAEATATWRQTDANGNYPPPPLNGTAHAWHHPLPVLISTINSGGKPFGGVMPSFAEMLGAEEIVAIIAYFQNLWPDSIYAKWHEINSRQ